MFTDVVEAVVSDPAATAGQQIRRSELPALRIAVMGLVFGLVLSLALTPPADAQQTRYMTGQNVVPVFEGWEHNADGTFSMVFGYMNRNYEEELDVPVGADNHFEPLDADQGQPAHFYARRQQFMFKVRVPKDWGQKDLVWTLTSHGKTEKAFGTLTPVWEIDTSVYQQNRGGPGELHEEDAAPTIALVGSPQRTVAVGEPLALDVLVTDDAHPTPRPSRSGGGGVAPRPARPSYHRVRTLSPRPSCGSTPTSASASHGSFIGGAHPPPWSSHRSAWRLQPARRPRP